MVMGHFNTDLLDTPGHSDIHCHTQTHRCLSGTVPPSLQTEADQRVVHGPKIEMTKRAKNRHDEKRAKVGMIEHI